MIGLAPAHHDPASHPGTESLPRHHRCPHQTHGLAGVAAHGLLRRRDEVLLVTRRWSLLQLPTEGGQGQCPRKHAGLQAAPGV
jgi:hypothetical protein